MKSTRLLGIDGRPAVWPRMGIGTYVRNLLLKIAETDDLRGQYRVYFDREPDPELAEALEGTYRVLAGHEFQWSKWSLMRDLQRDPVEWYLTFLEKGLPFLGNGSTRYCAVVNDMIPWALRETYLPGFLRRAYYCLNMLLLRLRVDRVWTISEFSRTQVATWLRIPLAEVGVLTLGVQEDMAACKTAVRSAGVPDGPYFVALGGSEPRKNNTFLVDLFRLHGDRWGVHLLVIGKPWRGQELQTTCRWVTRIPAVGDGQLRGLLSQSCGLLFPSLMEGFGLPAIEAMLSRCPVISNEGSSLTEVVGDGGILVPVDDMERWARAIDSLLANPRIKEDLVKKGLQRAKAFSVDEMLSSFLDNLQSLKTLKPE